MDDAPSFARLIEALRPWLGHLVIVGGWAHRLHRLHALAGAPTHPPVRTRDVDLAVPTHAPLPGDIGEALRCAGFGPTFLGEGAPPVTHYHLQDDPGFYAEFLAPLQGAEFTRRGKRDVTVERAGITAQKLRHLDVLLVAPWAVQLGHGTDVPVDPPADIRLPNPVSFMVQKVLIHESRRPDKRAQDLLYIHDTLELFGGALEALRAVWRDQVRPSMPDRTARRAETRTRALFENVTDDIRAAARIPEARRLSPETLRGAGEYGLEQILDD
jgi:hypothetical protein